jgi:ABC-2 type transport system permease protein
MTPTLSPQADATRRYGASYLGGMATLFGLTLRQYVHGKRWVAMAALFLVPAGLATLIRTTAPNVPPLALEFALAMLFIPQLVLPLTALIYASGMMQDEQEDQTITYLLIRPLPKWAIYVVKWLATVATTVVLTAVFTALTFAAIYAGTGGTGAADPEAAGVLKRCLVTISVHSLAIATYCSLFGLLGLVLKRTLVVGLVYTVVVEGLLANMPFGIRLMTVIYYTRIIAYRALSYELVAPDNGRTEDIAAAAWQLDVRRDPNLLAHPQTSTCIAVLLIACFVCTLLAAWICSQREFHVKTPEKG